MITDYMDKEPPDLTPDEIDKALARPDSFGYFGGKDDEADGVRMFDTWALGPVIEHRDSGLLDKSNAAVLKRELEKRPEWEDDWRITPCNHWAVGWVDHLSYRVIESEEYPTVTPIARFLKEWFRYLREEYPIADEDHWSMLEMEATGEWLSQEGPREASALGFKLPDDWYGRVTDWWDAHDSSALESCDDQGACPSRDQWRAAFEGCGFQREAE